MKKILHAACAVAALTAALAPANSFAHTYRHYHHYSHYRHYSHYSNRCHQRHMTNGTIIGAVGGGVVGGAMSHGNALPAVALGSGLGALAGHAIGARSGC